MTIISIDFSILYPGVCICRDFKTFQWIAVVNTNVTKENRARFDYINNHYSGLKIFHTSSRRSKDPQYHITERIKLTNYLELLDVLIEGILPEIEYELTNKKDIIFCLEGMSFGSKGNSLVDIAQATGLLKGRISNIVPIDKFFIFSPGELKMAIGCKGNAGKIDIFNKFKTDPLIEKVKESELYRLVNTESWVLDKKSNVLSPITDMIDSYLGIAKIYQLSK